jgi:molybdate transport system substrate-binding protein
VRRLLAALLVLAAVPAHAETLTVFAASSLTDAFGEMAREFEAAHPGTRVELQLAGSQVLRTQIEQGARADVFASADTVQMDALRKAGLVGEAHAVARNALVVVVPGRNAKVEELAHVARPHTRLVVAGRNVPAGRYTVRVLERIQASNRFGAQFQIRVLANIVSEEPSVRAVLAKVALGEADAGFVYASDVAAARGRVGVVEIPEALNVEAEYPIAVVADAPHAELAQAFVAFTLSPSGRMVLKRHGLRCP